MFEVVCIVDGKPFGLIKGEIYKVEFEEKCPICGNLTYKILGYDSYNGHYQTCCAGKHNGKFGTLTLTPPHHLFSKFCISSDFFRLVDYSFGEKIAETIELEESKKQEYLKA